MATASTGKVNLVQSYLDAIMRQREQKQRKSETTLGLFAEGARGFGDAFQARKGREHEAEQSELDRILEAGRPGREAEAGIEEVTGLQTAADTRIAEMYGLDPNDPQSTAEGMKLLQEAQARAARAPDKDYMTWLLTTPEGKLYQQYEERLKKAGSIEHHEDKQNLLEEAKAIVGAFPMSWWNQDDSPKDPAALREAFIKVAAYEDNPQGLLQMFDTLFPPGDETAETPAGAETGPLGFPMLNIPVVTPLIKKIAETLRDSTTAPTPETVAPETMKNISEGLQSSGQTQAPGGIQNVDQMFLQAAAKLKELRDKEAQGVVLSDEEKRLMDILRQNLGE